MTDISGIDVRTTDVNALLKTLDKDLFRDEALREDFIGLFHTEGGKKALCEKYPAMVPVFSLFRAASAQKDYFRLIESSRDRLEVLQQNLRAFISDDERERVGREDDDFDPRADTRYTEKIRRLEAQYERLYNESAKTESLLRERFKFLYLVGCTISTKGDYPDVGDSDLNEAAFNMYKRVGKLQDIELTKRERRIVQEHEEHEAELTAKTERKKRFRRRLGVGLGMGAAFISGLVSIPLWLNLSPEAPPKPAAAQKRAEKGYLIELSPGDAFAPGMVYEGLFMNKDKIILRFTDDNIADGASRDHEFHFNTNGFDGEPDCTLFNKYPTDVDTKSQKIRILEGEMPIKVRDRLQDHRTQYIQGGEVRPGLVWKDYLNEMDTDIRGRDFLRNKYLRFEETETGNVIRSTPIRYSSELFDGKADCELTYNGEAIRFDVKSKGGKIFELKQ